VFTKAFWIAAVERAIKTFAQFLAAVSIISWGDLRMSLSGAGLAALLSLVTSMASARFGYSGPSLANEFAVSDDDLCDPAADEETD